MEKNKRVKEILAKQLEVIKPSEQESERLNANVKEFLERLKQKLKESKFKADIFIGGSFAKQTVIRKKHYDVDIFLSFDKKIKEEALNSLVEKLKDVKGYESRVVKGSRNYLNFDKENLTFEVIPVIKIKSPKEARNITDLSLFHVKYIANCVKKNGKVLDEIRLCKTFVYASGCYGAESYIRGFSGYGLELLVCHYKSFMRFIEEIAKSKSNEKIVLDPFKHWKNKKEIMLNLNEAKLESPIILVDPTFKERNALAALSQVTFDKFKKYCKDFLKNCNERFFKVKEINVEGMKRLAERKKAKFVKILARTSKQKGDIAGSKLLKFYNLFIREAEKTMNIYAKEFEYSEKDFAYFYLVVKEKREMLVKGPPVTLKAAVKKFKEKYKKIYAKQGRIYARMSQTLDFNAFFHAFQKMCIKFMNDMSIIELGLVK
jgi:tRNA CCA-adding enzyme